MIQQSLKSNKIIGQAEDIFISLRVSREDDNEDDNEQLDSLMESLNNAFKENKTNSVVTYKRWVNVPILQTGKPSGKNQREPNKTAPERRTQYIKVKALIQLAIKDFNELKEHLERNSSIKKYIKVKKEEVLNSNNQVMLHVDWSECGTFHQPGIN